MVNLKLHTKKQLEIKVKVQGKFIRQSGGKGQYGDVWFEMEPLEPGKGIEFEKAKLLVEQFFLRNILSQLNKVCVKQLKQVYLLDIQ